MGFDLNKCYSHPGKLLKVHLENVALLSKRITSSDAAGLVSLFHDIGKVNSNFQEKLNGLCRKDMIAMPIVCVCFSHVSD